MNENLPVMEIEDRLLAGTYQKIPVLAARAEGTRLWDLDGNEYLDFMSGYGVAILGHSRPSVKDAIRKQLDEIGVTHSSMYSPARSDFLKDLSSILPGSISRTILSNSGSEAIEAAVKVALKTTGRRKVISMEKGYHGKTLASLSITHSNKYRKAFSDLLYPHVEFVKYGEIDSLEKILKEGDVAAVFVEPVQGEGGINLPPDGYFKELRELTEDNASLLVMDEIQTGLGRTGKMWGHQHWGIEPDLMTIGKGLGGGIPMSATSGKAEFMDSLGIGEHSSTTGGNPLACAAGSAVIKELRGGFVETARDTGKYILGRMEEEFGGHRLVSSSRGIGMMLALELRIRFLPVLMELINNGLITLYSGINTIRMLPPYIVSEEEVEEAIGIMKAAVDKQLAKVS